MPAADPNLVLLSVLNVLTVHYSLGISTKTKTVLERVGAVECFLTEPLLDGSRRVIQERFQYS